MTQPATERRRLRDHVRFDWRDLMLTFAPLTLLFILAAVAAVWLLDPAPPRTITLSAGPAHSLLMQTALQYKEILARHGVKVNVIESEGSVQNLQALLDPKQHVDLALVQGGAADGLQTASLMSLGSVYYAPIAMFYRGAGFTQLSQLEGKRIAIGREGSGTRKLSLKLLATNGITPASEMTLMPLDGPDAVRELIAGRIDAVFLNGDSATRELMLQLLSVPGISLMDFSEASAYTRLFPFLDEIDLPVGVLDLRRKIPARTVHLISPTVEIVARPALHPAISDLIIEAAQEVHEKPGLLQRSGQFPAAVAREFRVSEDAARYYRSGKSFVYRALPFWLASATDRMLVLLLPVAVLLFPALQTIPAIYRWRARSRIYRYYGSLIAIERAASDESTPEERKGWLAELDQIEASLNTLRMPLAFADAFYVLREHVGFVRARLGAGNSHCVPSHAEQQGA